MSADLKSALVTGGASGIGLATVERLLAAGWAVTIADFNADAGEAAVADLRGRFETVRFVRADASDEADIEGAVAHVLDAFGRLDCVVNNAGIGGAFGPVTEVDVADWDYTFAVLVRGVFLGTKHGVRAIRAQGQGGAIVNTASVAGLAGGIAPPAYSAAKAAVISFTQSAALELAPDRIRVNSVSPGVIDTPLVRTGTKDVASGMKGIQPWGEPGRPDHIARVIAFLASEDAGFMTGENVVVDGGLLAAGPRLGNAIGSDPTTLGLAGINRGTTGQEHGVRKVEME